MAEEAREYLGCHQSLETFNFTGMRSKLDELLKESHKKRDRLPIVAPSRVALSSPLTIHGLLEMKA